MAQTARQIHIAAQCRHPVAYWVLGGVVVASIGLVAIDQRLGFVMMMLGMASGGIISKWGANGQ